MAVDALNLNVFTDARTTPPPAPLPGDAYLVIATAKGAWTGQEGKIATWGGVSWAFATPLVDWRVTLELLPKVASTAWASNFAGWAKKRVSKADAVDGIGLTPDPTKLNIAGSTPPYSFTFNVATFAAQLISLGPAPALAGITAFANAWAAAVTASTVVVGANAFKPPTAPATLFSAVTGTVIDPASILLGKTKIIELASEPPPTGGPSKFPEKFRDAFKLLTITVTGTDNTPPTAGPLPLVVAAVPLL